jgi:cleavage stimulation factor subunit 2
MSKPIQNVAPVESTNIVQGTPQLNTNAEQQRALLVQIMSLTPEQINALPPQQRDQVLLLRSQLSPNK